MNPMNTSPNRSTEAATHTSHTPGPWHCAFAHRTSIFDAHQNEVAFVASYGAGFGPAGWPFPWRHAEANARLIAAAPELLTAAHDALAYLDSIPVPIQGSLAEVAYCGARHQLRQAIAKATEGAK